MDWGAVASILGERNERPIVLLDRTGRIRMCNRAMERVLGWSRLDAYGQAWARLCVPPDGYEAARRWMGDALRGALWECDALVVTSGGARLMFQCEFSLVGRGPSQGLLITVAQWGPAESSKPVNTTGDLEYEVASDPERFGELGQVQAGSEPVVGSLAGTRCYATFHGLQQPCADCPLRDPTDAPWPRIAVRPVTNGDATAGAFEIRSASRLDTGLVRIRKRTVDSVTLDAIQTAKIQHLADLAQLSEREREVLRYLLLGRSLDVIASLVGIAVRTVKYHQANVLQKLGADSRADLLRLLF